MKEKKGCSKEKAEAIAYLIGEQINIAKKQGKTDHVSLGLEIATDIFDTLKSLSERNDLELDDIKKELEEKTDMKCETCKFFHEKKLNYGHGECRRYPPKVLWWDSEEQSVTEFPIMCRDEGCGEWREKDPSYKRLYRLR